MKSIKRIRRILTLMTSVLLVMSLFVPVFSLANTDTREELVVGVPTDRCPIFYIDEETGEVIGIGIDLIRLAAERAGYSATITPVTEHTLKEALDNPGYDVILPFGSAVASESGKETVVSQNLMRVPFTLVSKDHKSLPPLNELRIGMLSSLAGGIETLQKMYPGIKIEMYDTMPECVRALRAGKVDALMHNSYVWSYVLQKPSYHDLSVQLTTMASMDFRVGAPDTEKGREIIAKLNKGIAKITDVQRQAIVLDYTSRDLYVNDFWDNLYMYRDLLLAGALIITILVILLIRAYGIARRRQEQKMRDLIETDPLTGILSMEGFKKRAEELIRDYPDNQYLLSFNNIKNFKYVNEKMGREAGDELLRFWAERSLSVLSDEEAVGRVTGDRFAVLRRYTADEQLDGDVRDVVEPVNNYFIDRGQEMRLQLCTGIYALTPEDHENIDVEKMLDYARIAEKKVRSTGKSGIEMYNPEQWEKEKQIVDISGYLPAALKNEEIQVWYQPQVDSESGEICGAEALCRWNHARLGWISPAVFIPILEESGLIYELDSYVWEKVCKDLQRWNRQGLRRSVSVNLSRSDISEERNIPGYFFGLTKKYDIEPEQLRIEITETAYVEHPEHLIRTTAELREYGFQVEMDDFGSGYSSLHMLKAVPVDCIKMDLHFLTGSGDLEKSRIIITQVIKLVHMLGMNLIAEGVETRAQAEFLKEHGCREMQGYYFYKPMPVDEFEKLKIGDGS